MEAEKRHLLERYIALKQKPNLLRGSFGAQTNFIRDPAKLKAAQCARRSGKSYGMGLYLFETARDNPGVSCLYVALTRDSAKRIMFKDVFKKINQEFELNAKFNEVELSITLPNGAIIYCLGMDQSEKEQDKALGQKFKLVVIDECASFRTDLKSIVYKTLMPAVADYNGTIALIGTTSNKVRGLFFDVTTGKEPGWSVHKWSYTDNPYTRIPVLNQIGRLKEENPEIVETPLFRQMYLNEWVIDEERLVYTFNEERNVVEELPEKKWDYVLGVDIGWNDDSAFSVLAWSEYDPVLYVIEILKRSKMDITDVANKIKDYQDKYGIFKVVIDGANKQAVQEIRRRHGVPLETADKIGKSDFIEIMNAEFTTRKIMLLKDKAQPLIDEYQTLIWDDKKDKRVENASCPNHAADATLYGWRYCYTYLNKVEELPVHPFGQEAVDTFWEDEERRIQEKGDKPFWEEEIF